MFEQALAVVDPIIMLFLLAAVGLVARRVGLLSDPTVKGVTMILLMIAQPALMLSVTQKERTGQMVSDFMFIMLASFVFLCLAMAAVYALSRKMTAHVRPVFAMLAAMPNVGFIGIPIIDALYGDVGTLYLGGFILGFNLAQWTVGVALFTGFNLKSLKQLVNPTFICAVIGALLFYFGVRLPGPVHDTVSQLGALTTPLAMITLGARLETLRPKHLLDRRLWLASGAKLILLPLILLGILTALGVSGLTRSMLVITMGMPSAAGGQMFAERYDRDAHFAARTISVTTLLCIVTLPLILVALRFGSP